MFMHWLGSVRPHPGIAPAHPRIVQSHPYESMAYLTLGGVLLPFPCTVIPLCLCLKRSLYPLTTLSTSVQTLVSCSDIS